MNFTLTALATIALLGASGAHAGSLARFSPESTTWTAVPSQLKIITNNGPLMTCEAYWTFQSNAHGKIQITALSAPACGVTFTGFPWMMVATGPGDGKARNIGWTSAASGTCADFLLWQISDTDSSVQYGGSKGGKTNECGLGGTFTPSPLITVVPK